MKFGMILCLVDLHGALVNSGLAMLFVYIRADHCFFGDPAMIMGP